MGKFLQLPYANEVQFWPYMVWAPPPKPPSRLDILGGHVQYIYDRFDCVWNITPRQTYLLIKY